MPPRTYTKTFLPLESNPEIFTYLAHNLGLSSALKFVEVYDLDVTPEEEVLAYVLAFPTREGYNEMIDKRDSGDFDGKEVEKNEERKVLWLRQTIHNACGLYALLHAACNGAARNYIKPDSILETLVNIPSSQQSSFLSSSTDLETLYSAAANAGDTATPEQDVEVDWHYTCFVPDPDMRALLELDGDRWGLLEHAILESDERDFSEKAREVIKKEYFGKAEGGGREGMFSVLALVREDPAS
ncbi:hypothetical protein E4T44_03051 [Aureobasidium sp. EXF-8845]|nr:hypothetical protein E4T44_03051 [Aureobasidium sp. EXF-8845]KAI4858475.1 hypothetical protein E4T45_00016 [Aureobasidium sp. EXF-8846]